MSIEACPTCMVGLVSDDADCAMCERLDHLQSELLRNFGLPEIVVRCSPNMRALRQEAIYEIKILRQWASYIPSMCIGGDNGASVEFGEYRIGDAFDTYHEVSTRDRILEAAAMAEADEGPHERIIVWWNTSLGDSHDHQIAAVEGIHTVVEEVTHDDLLEDHQIRQAELASDR